LTLTYLFFPAHNSVPGHEICGHITEVGSAVTKFKVGQKAGVGCIVDSCRECANCVRDEEQFCFTGMVGTFAGKFKYKHCEEYNENGGNPTYGGYSQKIVVDEKYSLAVPDNLEFSKVAPLLCAGITTYSPLKHFGLKPGMKLGVAGLGGLGHMAVKFGLALGAHVTVISRGLAKKDGALNDLHANAYLDSTNAEEFGKAMGSFDFILNTIAAVHDLNAYLRLLGLDGKMVMVGAASDKLPIYAHPLIEARRTLTGSLIGGIKQTQEMLDFCGEHNITSDVEVISGTQINEAYERTLKGDVKYRFVIDVSTF
jgi:alcohol dehydrogenase (NADP+)